MSAIEYQNLEKNDPKFHDLRRKAFRNTAKILGDLPTFTVFQVIVDRSFDWGWMGEVILGKHFIDGVYGKGGHEWFSGLPLSRAAIYAALAKLKSLGAVTVKKVRNLSYYAVNLEWLMSIPVVKQGKSRNNVPASIDRSEFLGDDFEIERAPQVVQQVDTNPIKQGKAVQQVDTEERTSSFRTRTEEKKGEADASLCAGPVLVEERKQSGIEAAIASVKGRAVALMTKRAARAAEHNGGALFKAFAAVARETWVEAGPLPLPTGKQIGRLRNHSKAWTHEGVTFLGFLEWSAANWRGVWASKMAHVPDPKVKELFSEYPSIESLLIFHKAFRDSYDRRDTQKIRAGLTRRDKLIRQFMFKGWSQADAERDADELVAREKVREDLDARAKDLGDAARRLQAKEYDLDTRIALGKARLAMQPVSTRYQPVKVVVTQEVEDMPPLPSISRWEWRDEEECASAG